MPRFPLLIILRGNSGSGKSSVAKELQQRLGMNTLLISQDVVRREMLHVRDGSQTPALSLLIELVKYGSLHCEVVILEGILNTEWYRPLFETAINCFSDNIFAYYYDLPFEETLKRHQTKANKNDFGETQMRGWWKEKDFIGFIRENRFDERVSLASAVSMILKDIAAP